MSPETAERRVGLWLVGARGAVAIAPRRWLIAALVAGALVSLLVGWLLLDGVRA